MANRTDPSAQSVHGCNPQFLFGKIVRSKVYDCAYWKENCFGLTAASLIDKSIQLTHVGGTYGASRKVTPFLCLTLKLLQIQPPLEIILEYIQNEEFKYLRALGVFYLRLVGSPFHIYKYLEPLYADYSKLCYRKSEKDVTIIYMDEVIDMLLTQTTVFEIELPSLPNRSLVEKNNNLPPYKSPLDAEFLREKELQ